MGIEYKSTKKSSNGVYGRNEYEDFPLYPTLSGLLRFS